MDLITSSGDIGTLVQFLEHADSFFISIIPQRKLKNCAKNKWFVNIFWAPCLMFQTVHISAENRIKYFGIPRILKDVNTKDSSSHFVEDFWCSFDQFAVIDNKCNGISCFSCWKKKLYYRAYVLHSLEPSVRSEAWSTFVVVNLFLVLEVLCRWSSGRKKINLTSSTELLLVV